MQVSNSEKCLMDILWKDATAKKPVSARSIINQLGNKIEWHDKTVKTLLNRLLKKGAIGFHKRGREYLYYPILEEENYVEGAVDSFLQRVFNGSVSSLVASFVKQEKLTSSDLTELKALIADLGKKDLKEKDND